MKKKIPPDLIRLLEKYGIASSEIDKEYSDAELNQLLEQVDHMIAQKKRGRLDVANQGNKRLFGDIVQIIFLGITGAASLLAEKGIGSLPAKQENEKRIGKEFTFDLVLHTIVASNLLTILFDEITKTTDTNEKNQRIIAETLKLTALLMIIQVAAKGNEDRMASLFEDFNDKISSSLEKIGDFLNEEIVTGNVPKGTSEELSLKMQQAKLALQKREFNQFINACKGALGLLDITPDVLDKNLKEIEKFAHILCEAISIKEESATTMAQAM